MSLNTHEETARHRQLAKAHEKQANK